MNFVIRCNYEMIMALKNESVTLDFAMKTVGKWKDTYQWIPIFGAFAAITTSFFAGANNLPAPVRALQLFAYYFQTLFFMNLEKH